MLTDVKDLNNQNISTNPTQTNENNPVKRGFEFENQVRDALKKIGLSDVSGGKTLNVGGFQIDVVAGINNCLLVISCVWTQKRVANQKLKEKIRELNGVKRQVKAGFMNMQDYQKYEDFKFIVVTNVKTSDVEEYAKENDIILWNYNEVLDYYVNLSKYVHKYAKYSLAGELGIKPTEMKDLVVPAFSTTLGGFTAYIFFVNARDLLERTYVARRERNTETYYQRSLDSKRIKKIAEYIKEGGYFPNNIIIAFDWDSKPEPINVIFKPTRDIPSWSFPSSYMHSVLLKFPNEYRACTVIDGQHRLFSFSELDNNTYLSVLALELPDMQEQAKLFIDINGKQKRIDPNLLWELQKDFRPDAEEGRIARTIIKLSEMEPFIGKISTYSKPIRGSANLAEICNIVKKTRIIDKITSSGSSKNPLYDHISEQNVDKAARILSNYFVSLKTIFSENFYSNFILRKNGIILFIVILEKLIATGKRPLDYKLYEQYIKPLSEYIKVRHNTDTNIKDLYDSCNTLKGRDKTYAEFAAVINASNDDFDRKLSLDSDHLKLKKLERKLSEFIYNNYIKAGLITLDKDTEGKIKSRLKPGEEFHIRMTLGNCFGIINNRQEIFDKLFIGPGKFPNRDTYLGALDYLKNLKVDDSHQFAAIQNKELFDKYIEIIMSILNEH